jgi:hypothetical protein
MEEKARERESHRFADPLIRRFIPCVLFLLLPAHLYAGVSLSGSVEPRYMFRTSDLTEISLPFRLVNAKLNYERGDFAFKANGALEYRWSNHEDADLQLREAYLLWYPEFGEVAVGKQILAWGTVDGNNPTDNLSAYDFYYMFSSGAERKLGSVSASANIYIGSWTFEAVVIPWHRENRLPHEEPDFPIDFPDPETLFEADDPLEFGLRVRTTALDSDLSLSYFRGHDRMHSPYESNVITRRHESFGYRKTQAIGGDLVTFISDVTLRLEAAYFLTRTPGDVFLAHKAEYAQYAVQLEYTTDDDIVLSCQLVGNDVLYFESDEYKEEEFKPGTGMPMANLADQLMMLSASREFMDGRLELKANGIENLKEYGRMLGGELSWSPVEALEAQFGVSRFFGDSGDPDNAFGKLEDFSHYTAGLKYSF